VKKMKELTSRDRILMTLQHKEPDCIPYDLGGTSNCWNPFRGDVGNSSKPQKVLNAKAESARNSLLVAGCQLLVFRSTRKTLHYGEIDIYYYYEV